MRKFLRKVQASTMIFGIVAMMAAFATASDWLISTGLGFTAMLLFLISFFTGWDLET